MGTEGKTASREYNGKDVQEFSAEDLAKIFHYPSVGQLFSDSTSETLGDFTTRMVSARDRLETIVRRGNRDDADKAGVAIKGINVTLDFLSSLQELRAGER